MTFLAATGRGSAQEGDVFRYGIDGPFLLSGVVGERRGAIYQATLEHEGAGPGAQGWSFGVAVESALITSVTVAGTAGDVMPIGYADPEGVFGKTQIIDPLKNGGVNGVVSSLALSINGHPGAVLPSNTKQVILRMTVEAPIPSGGGSASLRYQEGLIGSGQPVDIVATQDGLSGRLELAPPLEIELQEVVSCCNAPLNFGFSEQPIKDGAVFEGVIGVGEPCSADAGELFSVSLPGVPNTARVYVNIVSNMVQGNVQGWSYGIALERDAADIAPFVQAATVGGTSADTMPNGGYRDPESSFQKTQVLDPLKNGGRSGVVSAVALTTQGLPGAVFPSSGTQSILAMDVTNPQQQDEVVGTLRFERRLVGSGQPVDIVVTVNGESAPVCNLDQARLEIRFLHGDEDPVFFRRGDSNDDGRIDVADPIWTISHLLRSGPPSVCEDAADANDDGAEDTSDPVYLIDYLFRGLPAPPSPGPNDCAPDPTEDEIDCGRSLGC